MANQSNSSDEAKRKNIDFLKEKSKKQRFKRGFRRYANKNLDFGRKALIHRVQYRKMVWEKAPPLFIAFLIILTVIFLVIDFIGLYTNPLLFTILLILLSLAFILEIWYVGKEKKQSSIGRKIRRKKREEEGN